MKKLFLMALSIVVMACAYGTEKKVANYGDVIITYNDDNERTEVKVADLPQPVKDALAGNEFKEWKAEETAYLVKKESEKTEYYEITLKKEATGETKTIKLNKDGKKVE